MVKFTKAKLRQIILDEIRQYDYDVGDWIDTDEELELPEDAIDSDAFDDDFKLIKNEFCRIIAKFAMKGHDLSTIQDAFALAMSECG